jgi:hypothetical protein
MGESANAQSVDTVAQAIVHEQPQPEQLEIPGFATDDVLAITDFCYTFRTFLNLTRFTPEQLYLGLSQEAWPDLLVREIA